MFGQAPATPFGAPATPFGSPAPAPFGQPASSPFGQAPAAPSAFGQPAAAPTAFGATSTFGQPAAAPTAFGQPAAAPSAFGAPAPSAFGQPAAAPTAFGQPAQQTTSVFGQPAPASGGLFGAPAPAPAFGAPAPSAFGAAPKPLFGGGAAAPAPTGLFGAPAPAPSTGLFGAPAPAPSTPFGAPAPASTPFGAPAPAPAFGAQPSAFGSPAPAPLFGAAPAAGGFGAPTQQTAGTASVPYTTSSKQDGSNTIVLQSITGMPQFEQKSFEELRLEDYAAGNKGTKGQAATAPATGGFGGFGAAPQPAPAFGQPAAAPAGGLFGSPAPAPAGGLFGAPAPAPTAFGQPAAAPAPLFGAAPAQAPAGGLFGAPAPAPAFGAPAPAFGAAPAPAAGGLFGAPAPAAGGLFGAPAPAAPAPAGGLFGAPAPAAPAPAGGLFGSTPAPAPAGGLFGAPAPATGGLFGSTPAPAPAGGLFGAPAPAPSGGLFGATATPAKPGGLFGAPAPAPAGGLFGAPAPAPSGGLFGAPAPAPAGGLFGTPAPAPAGGLFGAPAPAPAGGLFGAPAAAAPVAPAPSAEALLAQQLAAVENQKKQLELVQAWSGNPSSGSKVVPSSYYDKDLGDWNGGGGSYATSSSALLSLRPAPRSAAKIRPRGYTSTTKQSPIASLGRKNGSPILSPNRFVGSATKTLFIKPNSLTPKPKTRLMLTNGITNGNSPVAAVENGRQGSPGVPAQKIANATAESPKAGTPSMNGDKSPGLDLYKQVVGSPDSSGESPNPVSPVNAAKHLVPKLTKRGYEVYPTMADLEAMSEAELATVRGFKVERPGFGSVAWDGAVDVREVDIDTEVIIESKNVSVYDDAETTGTKPEQGSKLNRPAVITMYGIFPKDGAEASAEAKQKLSRKIEKTTQKMKAELLSFESESGVWTFRVGHFSRYGLDDSDDETDDEEVNSTPLVEMEENELGGTSNLRAPMDEDESTIYTDASDMVDVTGEGTIAHEIIREGDMAYAMMTEEVEAPEEEAIIPFETSQDDEKLLFPDEAKDVITPMKDEPLKPTRLPHQSSSAGICSKLAAKSGINFESSSNIDYGMRMRRSFRVGWRPDGSFVHLQPSSSGKRVLVQSKPVLHQAGPPPATLPLLETHQKHSTAIGGTADEAPLFVLPTSKVDLVDALDDYSQSSSSCQLSDSTKQTVSNAFSLLTSLYGEDCVDDTRRLEALSAWLKGVVSSETLKDISAAESVGNTQAAIFAALAGGDTALASSIALESGNYRLSLLLANSGTQSQSLFEQQLKLWNESGAQKVVQSDLLRAFSSASGSADVEKTMFNASPTSYNIDWRRRFGMYLWSCPSSDAKVSDVVEKYNADVLNKLAPAATSVSGESTCLLFKMLNHYVSTGTPLSSILAPISHTAFRHDFSSSFHIGAMLSAVSSSNMSLHTECLVVDAIASQLIAEGSWEWAVYVTLCLLDRGNASNSTLEVRRIRAKAIVSRFYDPSSDTSAEDRREFLHSIGVPPAWFFESNAYRAQNNGDLFGLVENLKKVSLKDCLVAVESFLIPHMILEGKEACGKLRAFLDALSSIASEDCRRYWDKPFGCGSIHNFLILAEKVDKLSMMSMEEMEMHSDEIDGLLQTATDLEAKLASESADQSHLLAKIPHQVVLTPTNIVHAEVVAQLYLLRMQLVAIKNGQPLRGLTTQPYTQHAVASGFFAESMLRELAST